MTRVHGILLAACGALMLLTARRSGSAGRPVTIWPMVVILLAWLLATMASVDPSRSLARTTRFPLLMLALPAIQIASWRRETLRWALISGLAVSMFMVLDLLLAQTSGRTLLAGEVVDPTRASLGNRNDIVACLMLLPLAWPLIPEGWRTRGWITLTVVTSLAWLLTLSRQAAIAWLLACILPMLGQGGRKRPLIALILGATALLASALLLPSFRSRVIETIDAGLGVREQILAFAVTRWWRHPVLGNGPATFGELYLQAAQQGWTWRGRTLPVVGMPWPHNLPVEILCDYGLVGGIAFGSVLVSTFRRLRTGLASGGLGRDLATSSITMLAMLLCVGLVDLSLIKDWVRIGGCLAVGLAFAACQQAPHAEISPDH